MKFISLLLGGLALALAPAPAAAETTLKIATLAPEGSSWMKLFHDWQRAVEARTAGRVKVKFYAGGVQGDERDVLRKMKLGQLSGAAITAIGLGSIAPEARALEVARTYDELDFARKGLGDLLAKKFDEKGYVLLGWGDVGPVHLFSNRPVRTLADLQSLKMWVWSDDPITKQLLAALDAHGVPLGVPDVLPALSTGQIDAFFGSPLSTLALQWSSHAKYATSMVMGQATGATVLAKKTWETIAEADRAIVVEEAKAMEAKVIAQVRADNDKAMQAMRAKGLEVVPTPPELQKELQRRTEPVAMAVGQSFGKEFQEAVKRLLDEYRAEK